MKVKKSISDILELIISASLRNPLFANREGDRRSLHTFSMQFSRINCFPYIREGDWGMMKRVLATVMISFIVFSMFSFYTWRTGTATGSKKIISEFDTYTGVLPYSDPNDNLYLGWTFDTTSPGASGGRDVVTQKIGASITGVVDVLVSGTYQVSVWALDRGTTDKIQIDAKEWIFTAPATGTYGTEQFKQISIGEIYLPTGSHTVTLIHVAAGTAGSYPANSILDYLELENGLVGYWKFDEGSGNLAYDSSGHGNTGTIHTASWTDGKVGKALHFNGVDSWVAIPNSPSLTAFSQITLEAWIREDSITAQLKGIISKCDGWAPPTTAEYFLGTNQNGRVFFETDNGVAIFSSQTTPLITEAGRWYHVAGTWSGNSYVIYVDGQPVLSGTCTPQTTRSNTLPVQIGRHGTWSWVYFQGIIDEVEIYNYARTANDIQHDYLSAAGPVGYWNFDEGSGTVAHDSSGNGNHGTVVGVSWTNGVSGGALQFDGVDDYVGVPSLPSVCVTGNQMSVQLWMKPAVTLDANTPITNILDKGDEYGFQMDQCNYGRIWFFVWLEGAPWQGIQTTTSRWEANTWYLLTGTYDGNNLKVYVNGMLENSRPLSNGLCTSSWPLAIGSYCLGTKNFFNGAIDEVKIHNCARTSEEIRSDYASASALKRILIISSAGTFGEIWYLPDGTPFTLMSFLRDKGFLVDLWTDISNGQALSIDILSSYDVVILPSWFFDVQDHLQYQNALLDYVNQGGGLLFAGQSGFEQTLDGSLGFKYVDGGFVDASIVDSSNPIMQGISELPKAGGVFVDWDNVIADTPLPSNVAILARTTDPSNRIALIAFQYGSGRVVAGPSDGLLRPYGPTDVDSWSITSQPLIENKLLINAIKWVTRTLSRAQTQINAIKDVLDNLQVQINSIINVLYVLVALVVVNTVTTVYLETRKPKTKKESSS